jgi:hypothetical protein
MTLEIESAVAATFAAHLHTAFRLVHAGTTVELRLVEVADGSTSRQVSFSLLFHGPPQPSLAQQIYPFEHDGLGGFDLFIVPVRQDAQRRYYEGIVNRMIEPPPGANDRA